MSVLRENSCLIKHLADSSPYSTSRRTSDLFDSSEMCVCVLLSRVPLDGKGVLESTRLCLFARHPLRPFPLDDVHARLSDIHDLCITPRLLVPALLHVEIGIDECLGAFQIFRRESFDGALVEGDDVEPGGRLGVRVGRASVHGEEVAYGGTALARLKSGRCAAKAAE